MCSWHVSCLHKAFGVCMSVCQPGSCVWLLARFHPHLCPQSGSARAPAPMRTSPSDLCAVCKDLRVVCTWCARASLSARTNAPPHVWVHVPLSVCTFRVHAVRVCVRGAPRARSGLRAARDPRQAPHAPAGLTSSPPPGPPRPAAGLRDWPPAPSQPSPLPPRPPATRAPAVPAVPRGSGEAAPRCAPLPLAARAFVWRQLRPQRL